MRFLHTSDWHLGRSLFGASLLDEQRFALQALLEHVDRHAPDAVLIAGDVFDRSVPPESAVELLDWFLHETIERRGTPVFLIPGNHDSAERLGFGARLLRGRGLTIFSRLDDVARGEALLRAHPPRIDGAAGVAVLYGAPFAEPAFVAQALGDPGLRTHDQAMRALAERVRAGHAARTEHAAAPAVLLAHAFVAGGEESVESERPLAVGGSSAVSPEAFASFAYVALGHLHKPQTAGAASIRYSGSLLAYSKSEAAHAKATLLVDLRADGSTRIEELPSVPRRPLRALEGELAALLEAAEAESPRERDAFVIATLLDSGPVFDAQGKLRALYPHLLHVARQPSRLPELLPGASDTPAGAARARRGTFETFEEFFFEATGAALGELERSILAEAVAAAFDASAEQKAKPAPTASAPSALPTAAETTLQPEATK